MMKTAEQLIRNAKNRIQEVSVAELFEAMKNHKTILIDVREPDEFQAAAIDRAVNYPRGVLEMRIHQHPLVSHHCDTMQALEHLKDQPIYLICGTGGRSAFAAALPPKDTISLATFCAASKLISETTTLAPCFAKSIAVLFPIPEPAPVTRATLFLNRFDIIKPLS